MTATTGFRLCSPPFQEFVMGSGKRPHGPERCTSSNVHKFASRACPQIASVIPAAEKSPELRSARSLLQDLAQLLFLSHFLWLTGGGGTWSCERNDLLRPSGKSLSAAKVMFRFCSESCVWGGEIFSCYKTNLYK